MVAVIRRICRETGCAPSGLNVTISCGDLPGRGFGSETGALLGCAIAANVLSGDLLSRDQILHAVIDCGGTAPAAVAGLLGNLAVTTSDGQLYSVCLVPPQEVVLIAPDAPDSLYDGGRALERSEGSETLTALLVEALRAGDHSLMGRLAEHLGRKYPPEAGFSEAGHAALASGASAVFAHGQGLSAVAIARSKHEKIAEAMSEAFASAARAPARTWIVPVETHGISIDAIDLQVSHRSGPPVAASDLRVRY